MKGRNLIFLFLFLIVLIPGVFGSPAIYINGTVHEEGSTESSADLSYEQDGTDNFLSQALWYESYADTGIPLSLTFTNVDMGPAGGVSWNDIPINVGGSFTLTNHDTQEFAGTGAIIFRKSSVTTNMLAELEYRFDDNFVPSDTEVWYEVSIAGSAISQWYNVGATSYEYSTVYSQYIKDACNMNIDIYPNPAYPDNGNGWVLVEKDGYTGKLYCEFDTDFYNEYSIKLENSASSANIYRTGFGDNYQKSSRYILKNESGSAIYTSGYSTTNGTYYQDNGSYKYYIQAESSGTLFLIYSGLGTGETGESIISMDSSNYTYPDIVNVTVNLSDPTFASNLYYFKIEESHDGGTSWAVPDMPHFMYEHGPYLSAADTSTSLTYVMDQWSSFPFMVRLVLYSYNLQTMTETLLAYSDTAIYNDQPITCRIWTDKSSYQVGETVKIYYEVVGEENNIWLTDGFYMFGYDDVPTGTGYVTYRLKDGAGENWFAELTDYDNHVYNRTTFTVSGLNEPYILWLDPFYLEGENAAYKYYSGNASAVITIYDGLNNSLISFSTATGENTGSISTINEEPGIWLISMYHNGTFYNDTMTVTPSESFVSFLSDKYTVGETLQFRYFVTDYDKLITLYDDNYRPIVTFDPKLRNTLTGYTGTMDFTLSDSNEFSIPVETNIDNGLWKPGQWKIEVYERDSPVLYDKDTCIVSLAEDTPADSSNQMITVLFSKEGLFFLLTACLVMMGMAAVKHPAGGAAGGITGVGFGVYFSVLPVWILMLMVISLIFLAGIASAVHMKGGRN